MNYSIYSYELYNKDLNECIEYLSKNSDAYIEAVLYAKFSYKHSITDIKIAIEEYHNK